MKFSLTIAGALLASVAVPVWADDVATAATAQTAPAVDVLIRGGSIYDGGGGDPYVGDVLITGDRIVAVTHGASGAKAGTTVDAKGLAVAPGFINMLSWATESLLLDGRGMSDIKQGVTLEVMGEGWSMGPMNPEMKALAIQRQGDFKYDIPWTTLGNYLDYLTDKGISPNVASFVGAGTVRVHVLGEGDVDPDAAQLGTMRALVHQAMQEGAMGVGSSLIYAPNAYAETPELVALATEAARCGGMYISHMRSEGDHIEEAVDELIDISRQSGAPAEIYHLKFAGKANWGKYDAIVAKVEAARKAGQRITADMYTYTAGATGLDAAMPTWVQAGGYEKWAERLKDPEIRARVIAEMKAPGKDWENLYNAAGTPDNLLLLAFKNPELRQYTGKTLGEVAKLRGTSPEETAIDLVIEDGSRVGTAYFLMSEDNVRKAVDLPWMSFGSDEEAAAPEGLFLNAKHHPRAYGNVARLLGKYVRNEQATSLQSAIRRLSSLPAGNLGIRDRGTLAPGYFADVVLFDPATVQDHATFEEPDRYATGVRDVFVNGVQVLKAGEHTGATPGKVVRGPGWTGWPDGGACAAGRAKP